MWIVKISKNYQPVSKFTSDDMLTALDHALFSQKTLPDNYQISFEGDVESDPNGRVYCSKPGLLDASAGAIMAYRLGSKFLI
jgi:hypothetical protein